MPLGGLAANGEGFRAQLKVGKKTEAGPWRSARAAADRDMAAARATGSREEAARYLVSANKDGQLSDDDFQVAEQAMRWPRKR